MSLTSYKNMSSMTHPWHPEGTWGQSAPHTHLVQKHLLHSQPAGVCSVSTLLAFLHIFAFPASSAPLLLETLFQNVRVSLGSRGTPCTLVGHEMDQRWERRIRRDSNLLTDRSRVCNPSAGPLPQSSHHRWVFLLDCFPRWQSL